MTRPHPDPSEADLARLAGLAFTWRVYRTYSASWDHDHCEVCGLTFAPTKTTEGYANLADGTTEAGHHWICRDCFDARAEALLLTAVESDPEAWPYDTPAPD